MNAQTKIEATAPDVFAAISDVMGIMSKEGIGKGRKNAQQGYNFRGIDDMYNALSSVLAGRGLVVLPFVQDMKREERQTKLGGALNYTILTVDFTLASAKDGSQVVVRTVGEAMDSADKSANKAQSAALKYAAMQVFMIPTEGDNDADATTHEVAPAEMPPAEYSKLVSLIEETGIPVGALLKEYKVKSIKLLSQADYMNAVQRLTAKLADKAKAETNAVAETTFGELIDDEIPY